VVLLANLLIVLAYALMALVQQPEAFFVVAALAGVGWTLSASELWVAAQRAIFSWWSWQPDNGNNQSCWRSFRRRVVFILFGRVGREANSKPRNDEYRSDNRASSHAGEQQTLIRRIEVQHFQAHDWHQRRNH